jgi:hypothetical protein
MGRALSFFMTMEINVNEELQSVYYCKKIKENYVRGPSNRDGQMRKASINLVQKL